MTTERCDCLPLFLNRQLSGVPEFDVKIVKLLERNGIYTVEDLVQVDDHYLLEIDGIGRKALNAIKTVLQEMELTLGMKLS